MPGAEALQTAQVFGPSIWFAVFVIVVVVGVGAAYMRWVHLPQQQAMNDNNALLASAVNKLTDVVSRMDERTVDTHERVIDTRSLLNAVVIAKEYEAAAILKMAEKLKVDVQTELAGIQSVLRFSRGELSVTGVETKA